MSAALLFCALGTRSDPARWWPARAPIEGPLTHRVVLLWLQIDILYAGDVLPDELIIMDVAYMYNWERVSGRDYRQREEFRKGV